MTGDTHYDLEILAELAEGLLDVGTARQVREHLAVCDPCGELLADLAAVREVLAATPTPAMPMGVALRIDKALAAEAESRRGGVGLVETPDWDELMRDAPWERQAEVPEPARLGAVASAGDVPEVEEPVRLGVVSDDGTIVPARTTRTMRRRRWAMPAVAAAAAAVVVGTAVASTGLLASGGDSGAGVAPPPIALPPAQTAEPSPSRTAQRAKEAVKDVYVTNSDHNYSDPELRMSLESFMAPAPAIPGDSDDAGKVAKCVNAVSKRAHLRVFAVDQGQYNGQEALIMASWKQQAAKKVRVDVVDPFNCKSLRKPALGRW